VTLTERGSPSAAVREQVDHPIIDADGHFLELSPLFVEEMTERIEAFGGAALRDRFSAAGVLPYDQRAPGAGDEPSETRRPARPWWGWPTRNTLDRATGHFPGLLYERLDELGIDFTILYPSHGLAYTDMFDADLAQGAARAINEINAEAFRPYADRMTPAAVIPMHTPQQAIEEAEHAVNVLGLKAILIAGYVTRPIPKIHREHPELLPIVNWLDTFGLDSEHDYDPLWQKCVDLHVAPVSHSGIIFWRATRSTSSFMYNHINAIGHAHESLCKSLFMGGVTRRFPTLRFGFLEGGVGWGCGLFADMIGHWEKRNGVAVRALDPAELDVDLLLSLLDKHGDDKTRAHADELRTWFTRPDPGRDPLDEWSACKIEQARDIKDLFVPRFYFGCEADDPMNAWAFNDKVNPFESKLRAMFGSDISHWDVPEMNDSVHEAWEQVERGMLTEGDFREFVFTNVVRLHAGTNPDFFKGTTVEAAAAAELAADRG
jgi:predicted TIM-barrel fold metal-dependent hydrolase